MNRQKFRSILMFLCIGVFIVTLVAASVVPALAQPLAAQKTSRLVYHDEWRKLWEDHITWTRVVILGILDGLPGTNTYVDRLLQNPGDMAAALKPYYGDQADVLGGLITDHLTIAAQLLTAAKNGDTAGFNDAKVRWYANAHDIAVQMNKMNPQFWPLQETEQMWDEHLDATLDEATANLTGDYGAEVAAYDKVHDLALIMADFFSNGVMQQFPNRFSGSLH
jgi:hypothetical protein